MVGRVLSLSWTKMVWKRIHTKASRTNIGWGPGGCTGSRRTTRQRLAQMQKIRFYSSVDSLA